MCFVSCGAGAPGLKHWPVGRAAGLYVGMFAFSGGQGARSENGHVRFGV